MPPVFGGKRFRGPTILIRGLAEGMNRVACVVLFLMMLLTLADVLLRKIFNQGVLGSLELSEFMMAAVVFCALAEAEVEDRHIRVDLIAGPVPAWTRRLWSALLQLLSCMMTGAIAVSTFLYALTIRQAGEISPDLGLPRYPLIFLSALGCALLCVVMLLRSLIAFSLMRRS